MPHLASVLTHEMPTVPGQQYPFRLFSFWMAILSFSLKIFKIAFHDAVNSRWDVYYDLFVTTFGSCFMWTYSYVRARNLTWIGLTCWSLFVKILEDVAVSLAGTTNWELQPRTVDIRGVSTRVFIIASLKIAAERSMWKNIYIFLPLHNKLGIYIYIYI